MRTKVLLCAAAIAASALSVVAQSNVYSLNVVGYINLSLGPGFNLVANQLDLDGTGTNNTVDGVFSSNVPEGTVVYTFNPAASSFNTSTYAKNKQGVLQWSFSGDSHLNPGQGAWVKIPTAAGAQTVTTVGQVLQGNLSNPNFLSGGGFTLVSSMIPLSGGLTTGLNYVPTLNESAYFWNGSAYSTFTYAKDKSGNPNWSPSEPPVAVGQGMWIKANAGASWKTNFTVQ